VALSLAFDHVPLDQHIRKKLGVKAWWNVMKTISSRKLMMLFGSIMTATLAAGCFGGNPGYSNNPYGYNESSYSYSDSDSGYLYPQSYRDSYGSGYRNGVRADGHRDRDQARDTDRHVAVTHERGEPSAETQHSTHDKHTRNNSGPGDRSENN